MISTRNSLAGGRENDVTFLRNGNRKLPPLFIAQRRATGNHGQSMTGCRVLNREEQDVHIPRTVFVGLFPEFAARDDLPALELNRLVVAHMHTDISALDGMMVAQVAGLADRRFGRLHPHFPRHASKCHSFEDLVPRWRLGLVCRDVSLLRVHSSLLLTLWLRSAV